jgi:hypothetical protein
MTRGISHGLIATEQLSPNRKRYTNSIFAKRLQTSNYKPHKALLITQLLSFIFAWS